MRKIEDHEKKQIIEFINLLKSGKQCYDSINFYGKCGNCIIQIYCKDLYCSVKHSKINKLKIINKLENVLNPIKEKFKYMLEKL